MSSFDIEDLVRVKEMEVGKRYYVFMCDPETHLRKNRIPMECVEEHKWFYTCKVLPHYAEGFRFDKSHIYTTSIMKIDMDNGETRVYRVEEGEL